MSGKTVPPDSQASIDLVAPSIPVVDLLVRTSSPAAIRLNISSDHFSSACDQLLVWA